MKKLISTPNGDSYEDMTAEEITALENEQAIAQTKINEEIAKEQAKEANQASGNQKLLDLGLTQAEATALTGYTPPVEE